jgi:uncharacterized HAD superfamily protein
MKADGTALRYNQGKIRYDLIPSYAQEQYARVLTVGAEKYGPSNWRKGLSWTSVIASTERHLEAIKRGEDYDPESGLLHSAHIMCNAGFLSEYYKIYPQGDDRQHSYLNTPKIGLDIDEVLSKFTEHYNNFYNLEVMPEVWNFDNTIEQKMQDLQTNREFWLTMPIKTQPGDLTFEPHCYITSRSIPQEWTEEWITKNGFPTMPIYTVGFNQSKLEAAKSSGIDIMIDDRMHNFVEFNRNGICCYLLDAPHNRRYNVGHKRIYTLKEFNF